MPCTSGRSMHILCKSGCQTGCACCVNTAYSVSKLCCDEPLLNKINDLTVVYQQLCSVLLQALTDGQLNSDNTFQQYTDEICAAELPSFGCTVTVYVRYQNEDPIQLVDIRKGECINNVATTDFAGSSRVGDWTLSLDNHVCGTFEVTLA